MKKKIPFKCPHQNFSCPYVDTYGMLMKSCSDCEHYVNGVRISKGLPDLRIKNWDEESFFVGFVCGIIFLAILVYFL